MFVDAGWNILEDQPRYFEISFITITNSWKKRKIDFYQKTQITRS